MERRLKTAAIGLIALCLALAGGRSSVGAAFCAFVLEVVPFAAVSGAVGIDYDEPSGKLLVTINSPTGAGGNFGLLDPVTGVTSPFTALAGLPGEIKVATVKSGACLNGFAVGDAFAGNGIAGQIIKITAGGGAVTNPWTVLPGEPGQISGLYQDRHCAIGGDLVVVTTAGSVWRITSAGVPSLVVNVG